MKDSFKINELAHDAERAESRQREPLLDAIRAYCRLLWAKEPTRFQQQPIAFGDSATKYEFHPPRLECREFFGPLLHCIEQEAFEDIPSGPGETCSFKRVPVSHGLYVDQNGTFFGAFHRGTGQWDHFDPEEPGGDRIVAACQVDVTIAYKPIAYVTLEQFRETEVQLRELIEPYLPDH